MKGLEMIALYRITLILFQVFPLINCTSSRSPLKQQSSAIKASSQHLSETAVPLGYDQQQVRFKMLSISGKSEYIIELPRGAFHSEIFEDGKPYLKPDFYVSMSRIQSFFHDTKYLEAIAEIENLLEYYPTSIRLYQVKGSAYIRIGELGLAEDAWRKAAKLDPENKLVHKALEKLSQRLISRI